MYRTRPKVPRSRSLFLIINNLCTLNNGDMRGWEIEAKAHQCQVNNTDVDFELIDIHVYQKQMMCHVNLPGQSQGYSF